MSSHRKAAAALVAAAIASFGVIASAMPPQQPSPVSPHESGLVLRLADLEPTPGATEITFDDHTLWLKPGEAVTGDMVAEANPITDQRGHPAIAFKLNAAGRERFARMTAGHIGKPVAILVDGRPVGAPVLMTPITGGEGQITGAYTREEAARLAADIMHGAGR
jgi:preprotein translocase subunit SecD